MRVIKRGGEYEDVSFDKVLNRIKLLSNGLTVDIYDISQKVCTRIYDLVHTHELDELAAHICSSLVIENPDYGILASRIIISNHHKNTSPSFSETIVMLYNNKINNEQSPLINDTLYEVAMKNKEKLNSYINYERDYYFDYFGFKTLERSYLLKVGSKAIERPQHMFMRVALGIHSDDLKEALQTYDYMSKKYFTHATPTLFNSGTVTPQLSSCFLNTIEDSIDGIFDGVKECARISKHAGGIGMHIHDIRAKGSRIRSTNGISDGIVPMLKVFNHVGRYINQCFVPDTLVFTNKGIVKMKDIAEGNQLLTYDIENNVSSFKSVLGVAINQINTNILEITTAIGTDSVRVTKEHQLYVKKDENTNAEFISACELQIGHFMGYPEKDNICWFKITEINEVMYEGDVYDFNMEDNHNYTVVNLGLVHNSGKRNGSIAIYLEPWHADIESFLDLKKPHGNEEDRARDLFYALWIPNLFMERVRSGGVWSLMCPDQCPGLSDVYGEEFDRLYINYETEGKYRKQMSAQELWFKIMEAQIETGTPYILYKDAANMKSNQQNLGTIKSSNLCVAPETVILTDKGYLQISTLKDKVVNVWNGKEFSETTVKQTGKGQKLLTIIFDNSLKLRCTPYHKFYIQGTSAGPDGVSIIEARNLLKGMQVIKYTIPFQDELIDVTVHITGIEDNGEHDDTYCFNEPKEHKGIFNGILTGNCTEIIEYSSPDETAVCNLLSICLPTFIIDNPDPENSTKKLFDFEKLHEIAMLGTKNLNKIIDINFYPIEKARRSNLRHRPIGIGVQGLADTYIMMGFPFDSPEAADLNRKIFETIYHGAAESSMLIAKKRHELYTELKSGAKSGAGAREAEIKKYLNSNEYENLDEMQYPGSYSSFMGSPAQKGKLQFDLWNFNPGDERYDWTALKSQIAIYGIRNSLLVAPMPTASTSQIMGFNEGTECITSNIYKRKTLAGEFVLVNKYLIKDLLRENLWNKEIKNKILVGEGSIQHIPEIPIHIRNLYKTVWEISQKVIIDQAADRGPYICQSQSMNLFMEDPDFKKLTSMSFYAFDKKLKTGCYYLRSKPKAKVQQFTIEPVNTFTKPVEKQAEKQKREDCTPNEDGVCLLCSS